MVTELEKASNLTCHQVKASNMGRSLRDRMHGKPKKDGCRPSPRPLLSKSSAAAASMRGAGKIGYVDSDTQVGATTESNNDSEEWLHSASYVADEGPALYFSTGGSSVCSHSGRTYSPMSTSSTTLGSAAAEWGSAALPPSGDLQRRIRRCTHRRALRQLAPDRYPSGPPSSGTSVAHRVMSSGHSRR